MALRKVPSFLLLLKVFDIRWHSPSSSFNTFLLTTTLFFLSRNLVESYSWGAGSCDAGGAVGGFHLEAYNVSIVGNGTIPDDMRCIHTGTLRRAEIDVVIGDHRIVSDTEPIQFLQFDTEYKIQVFKLTSIFRGIFIRLSSLDDRKTDLSGMLYTTDPLLTLATLVCTDPTAAVGVTHNSPIDKDLVYATLRLNGSNSESNVTTSYALEITVVGANNAQRSIFAYSSYEIQVAPSHSAAQQSGGTVQSGGKVASQASAGDASATKPNHSDADSSSRKSLIIGVSVLVGSVTISLLLFRSIRRPRVQSS
jgi:hypothetical protein